MNHIFRNSIGKPPLKLSKYDLLFLLVGFLTFIFISYVYVFYSGFSYKSKMLDYYSKLFISKKELPIIKEQLTIIKVSSKKISEEFPLLKKIPIKFKSDKNIKQKKSYLVVLLNDYDHFYSKINDNFPIEVSEFSREENNINYFPVQYLSHIHNLLEEISITQFLFTYLSLIEDSSKIKDKNLATQLKSVQANEKILDFTSLLFFLGLILFKIIPRFLIYKKRERIFLKNFKDEDLLEADVVEVKRILSDKLFGQQNIINQKHFFTVVTKGKLENTLVYYRTAPHFKSLHGRIITYQNENYFIPFAFNFLPNEPEKKEAA